MGDSEGAADIESPGLDTDTNDDTDTTDDTDTIDDTDTMDDTDDTDVIEEVLPPPGDPPTNWGGAFVDLSAPLLGADAFIVDVGLIGAYAGQQVPGVWVDLDGDGREEVVVTNQRTDAPDFEPAVRVYSVESTGLVRQHVLESRFPTLRTLVVGAMDLDEDGHPELLTANGEASLYWGEQGGWGEPVQLDPPSAGNTYGGALGLWDADRDGWLDLLSADDGCDTSVLPYLRTGLRTWEPRDDLVPEGTSGTRSGYATLAFTLASGDDVWSPIASSCDIVDPHPGFVIVTSPPEGTPSDLLPSDAYWRLEPQFVGQPFTAVMPMGAAATDLNGDGLLDLVMALGHERLAVFRGHGDGTFSDASMTADIRFPGQGTFPDIPWAIATPDLDQDGLPEIVVTIGDDDTSFFWLQGHEVRPVVMWNAGHFRFRDVTDDVGLSLPGNWKALAVGDPDGDGDADLVLGGQGVMPRVLRNDLAAGGHGFSLELRGTLSNSLGIGARVEVVTAGLPSRVWSMGELANPMGMSSPMIFVGLGPHIEADLVRITWPSGFVQEVAGLEASTRHRITEPVIVSGWPEDRRLAADGGEMSFRVDPRHPDGSPNPAATVEVSVEGAPAAVTSLQRDGDGWSVVLQAPSVAGVSRVEIIIDGVALLVRPSIWWTEAP